MRPYKVNAQNGSKFPCHALQGFFVLTPGLNKAMMLASRDKSVCDLVSFSGPRHSGGRDKMAKMAAYACRRLWNCCQRCASSAEHWGLRPRTVVIVVVLPRSAERWMPQGSVMTRKGSRDDQQRGPNPWGHACIEPFVSSCPTVSEAVRYQDQPVDEDLSLQARPC